MGNNKKIVAFSGTAIFMLLLIVYWIYNIKQGKMPYFDQWNRAFVPLFADTPIYTVFRWITELGSKSFVQPMTIALTIVLWIWYKDYLPALTFGLGTLGAHIANNVIKELIGRERPSVSVLLNAEGYSFPSGHAMVSIVCYGLLAYFISKKCSSHYLKRAVQIGFACLILLIGLSRYIINVHFLTDIISGYVFGFMILISLLYIYGVLQKKRIM